MSKGLRAALTALVVMAVPPSSQAGDHGDGWHEGHGHGHGWGHGGPAFRANVVIGGFYGPGYFWPRPWGPYFGYGYGPVPYAYAPPPVVVQQAPQVYVHEEDRGDSAYWYYCQSPQGYYPYVPRCASGWMQVVPPEGPPS